MKKKMTDEELHKEMSREISGIKKTLEDILAWYKKEEEKHTRKGNYEFRRPSP